MRRVFTLGILLMLTGEGPAGARVLELDGNILTVKYQGACGGCPSAMMGTLQAIEGILRTEFNPYLEVVAL